MRRRGFTLLEMLIALALTIGLLAAMFSFFWNLLATRERIIEETSRRRAVDTLIDHLEGDLLTALVGDRVSGAGIMGDETRIRVLSRGVPVRLAERGGATGFADLERSEYRFEQSSRTLSARRRIVQSRGVSGAEDAASRTPPGFSPLGGVVHRVRFRYHDGESWAESFDSLSAGSLPRAIEIAIWFDPTAEEVLAGAFTEGADDLGEPIAPPDRLTFDSGGGFDEREFAIESDLDQLDEPRPDRVRVIGLVDAIAKDATEDEEPEL